MQISRYRTRSTTHNITRYRCSIRSCIFLILLSAVFYHAGFAAAQEIVILPSRSTGIYSVQEEAVWQLKIYEHITFPSASIRYVLRKNGLNVYREGILDSTELKATMNDPGTLLAELKTGSPNQEMITLAGAAFGPEKINPSQPRPHDFDAFWNQKILELQKVPDNAVIENANSGRSTVHYAKIQMDGIRGTKIYGQLAKPASNKKLPALLILQWAGVYPLQRDWVVWRAESGWLTLNIMAHDLPFDQPHSFYEEAGRTTHANYENIGNDDREKSTFLRMYLSCYRAVEYLTRQKEWDGHTLVVMGTSQGGMLALVAAALHPNVTACLANTPAGCDLNGPIADRAPGWPAWYWPPHGKDPVQVRRTSQYFDIVNFAPRVKCPTLVILGLVDTVCPPAGIFSMSNQLNGPREIIVLPTAGHGGTNRMFDQHSQSWLDAIAKGDPPPAYGMVP